MNHLDCTILVKGVPYELYRSANVCMKSKSVPGPFPLIRKFIFRSVDAHCSCCANILPEYTVEVTKTDE